MRDLEIPLPARRRFYVRLEELAAEDGDPRGRRVWLKEPNLAVMRLSQEWDALTPAEKNTQVERLWALAGHLLPDLAEAELSSLGYGTIAQVLVIGQQPLVELEQAAKNAAPPSA